MAIFDGLVSYLLLAGGWLPSPPGYAPTRPSDRCLPPRSASAPSQESSPPSVSRFRPLILQPCFSDPGGVRLSVVPRGVEPGWDQPLLQLLAVGGAGTTPEFRRDRVGDRRHAVRGHGGGDRVVVGSRESATDSTRSCRPPARRDRHAVPVVSLLRARRAPADPDRRGAQQRSRLHRGQLRSQPFVPAGGRQAGHLRPTATVPTPAGWSTDGDAGKQRAASTSCSRCSPATRPAEPALRAGISMLPWSRAICRPASATRNLGPASTRGGNRCRLARAPARWAANVQAMKASNAPWQLVTTFNEWGEGTAVESAQQWASYSGYGTYLDTLHHTLSDRYPRPPPAGGGVQRRRNTGGAPKSGRVLVRKSQLVRRRRHPVPIDAVPAPTWRRSARPGRTTRSRPVREFGDAIRRHRSGEHGKHGPRRLLSVVDLPVDPEQHLPSGARGREGSPFVRGGRATAGCSASGNAVPHIPALYFFGGYTDATGSHTDHDFCSTEVRPYSEFNPNAVHQTSRSSRRRCATTVTTAPTRRSTCGLP